MRRLRKITDALDTRGIEGLLVSNLNNVRYLSGFSGSSGCLLVTKGESFFFTDFRYEEQAHREVAGFQILIEREERPKLILKTAKDAGIRTLGFESTASYGFYRSLLRKGFRIRAVTDFVEDMRKVKDRVELELIREAVLRAEKAFVEIKPFIRKGTSERQIAERLEYSLKKEGCDSIPFDIIVAAGARSSMPHARPTDGRIRAGDLVVVDWGGEAGGYFSDMTRTLLINGPGAAKKREIYETVLKANTTAMASVAEGAHARAVDRAARDFIEKAGYGNFFGHGTGHGVGLEVHEAPRISRLGRDIVKAGMVFTIEPGIYVPGLGGVRIEDMVVAEKRGCRVLTTLPRELEIINS